MMDLSKPLPPPVPLSRLASAVLPIYVPDDDPDSRKPEIAGSGVIVEVGGVPFLFTAAHVLDINDEQSGSFYLAQGGYIEAPIECPAWKTVVPEGIARDDDPIDVGIMQLSAVILARTGRQPLTLENIDAGHRFGGRNEYAFYGFPDSRTKARAGLRKVVSEDFLLRGRSVPHNRYVDLSPRGDLPVTPESHVVMYVDTDRIVTDDNLTPRKMVDPHGISGGGVFRLTVNREAGYLVGIVLGKDPATNLFMGGHVRTWLGFLEQACPETAEAIRRARSA